MGEQLQPLQLSSGHWSPQHHHNSSPRSVLAAKSKSIPDWARQTCAGCGDTLTHCCGVAAFIPVIPAVAAVPGFCSASGNAQYLTPKASCSSVGYWALQRVLLDLRTSSPVLLPLPLARLSPQFGCCVCGLVALAYMR